MLFSVHYLFIIIIIVLFNTGDMVGPVLVGNVLFLATGEFAA